MRVISSRLVEGDMMRVRVAVLTAMLAIASATAAKSDDAADCANAAVLLNTDGPKVVAECRRLADQGDAAAQNMLGNIFAIGTDDVPYDDDEAIKWYRKSAEQGFGHAQYNLAIMYVNGSGVAQDIVQAYMWFNLSAESYPPGIQRKIVLKARDFLIKNITPVQIGEAQRLAREWKPKTNP